MSCLKLGVELTDALSQAIDLLQVPPILLHQQSLLLIKLLAA